MAIDEDVKLIGIALPLAVVVFKWLRNHNDRTLTPPSPPKSPADDGDIEQLLRAGRQIEAIKAARQRYGYDLMQAKLHVDDLRKRLKSG